MNDVQRDELLAALLDQPKERARLLATAELNAAERDELEQLVAVADEIWLAGYEAPALNDDPVAAMLGLVATPTNRLNAAAFTSARKTAGLKGSEVADLLARRGWKYSTRDIARWELQNADDVPPAVIEALADIVHAPLDRLVNVSAPAAADQKAFAAVRATQRFADLAARWAAAYNMTMSAAVSQLESRSLATVHRGSEPDVEQLLASLEALVSAVERRTAAES